MKRFVIIKTTMSAVAALALSGFAAAAADYAPAPALAPVPPVYNWTGLYLGVNGGGGFGQQNPYDAVFNRFDATSIPFGGGLVGGTAGAQIQMSHVVMGFEADLDWAGISGTATRTPSISGVPVEFDVKATTHINWEMSARARVGYAIDNWLPYVTLGAAVLGANTNLQTFGGLTCGSLGIIGGAPGKLNCSGTKTRLGATIGAGVEYGFTPNWSAKLEYRYTAAASFELSHLNEFRAGVNYRFGGL